MFDYEMMKVKMKVNVIEGQRGIGSRRATSEKHRGGVVLHISASFPSGITYNSTRNLFILQDAINVRLTRIPKHFNHFKYCTKPFLLHNLHVLHIFIMRAQASAFPGFIIAV